MDTLKTFLELVWDFIVFIVISVLFIPSYLIVNTLQKTWTDKLTKLFGI